jgi:4-hydroxybenzoate polyprenyltransferase
VPTNDELESRPDLAPSEASDPLFIPIREPSPTPRSSRSNNRDVLISLGCLAFVVALIGFLPHEVRYVPLVSLSVLGAAIINLVLIVRVHEPSRSPSSRRSARRTGWKQIGLLGISTCMYVTCVIFGPPSLLYFAIASIVCLIYLVLITFLVSRT